MNAPLLFLDVGGSEILLILVVVLVFFGPSKIPDLARGLGKGIREFKDASNEIRSEFERAATQASAPAPPVASPYVAELSAPPAEPAAGTESPLPVADYTAPAAVDLPGAGADAAPLPPEPVVVTGGVPGTRARGSQLSTTDA